MNATQAIDRRELLDALAGLVPTVPGSNVLLAGPWGSGKSTVLRHLHKQLATDYEVIQFAPSEQIAEADPRIAFLRHLKNHADRLLRTRPVRASVSVGWRFPWLRDPGSDNRKRLKDLLRTLEQALPPAGATTTFVSLTSALVADSDERPLEEGVDGIRRQRLYMRRLLDHIRQTSGKACLLLVDDLDRTRPEQAVAFLESLYYLILAHGGEEEIWPLTSVWAVNTAVLEEYLYREYREIPSFDPAAYLEKLFPHRVAVPPLFALPSGPGRACRDGAVELWKATLAEIKFVMPGHRHPELAEWLAQQVNYAQLGNLRLHARLRRDCARYWQVVQPVSRDEMVRQARLLFLVAAFSGFRDHIALYGGMWPQFINRLNERLRTQPLDIVANPVYRHIDSADLATLLTDLGAIDFDARNGRYALRNGGIAALQNELAETMAKGF